jgi:acetyl esterase/lipase
MNPRAQKDKSSGESEAFVSPACDWPLEPLAAKMEPTRKIVYKTLGGRSLMLHVFEPGQHRATDKRPVYLTFHGGGWAGRDPRYFYPFAKHFADRGMVGISVQYRLFNPGQGITVFDCVKDARSAMRYVRTHANDLGIDPTRIVATGGSAGAHLAVGTALFTGIDEADEDRSVSCLPNLLILYYPVIDTSENGYGRAKIGERWRELSPVDHVRPGLPPTLILHGTADTVTPFAGALRFQALMQKACNTCELIAFKGGAHGYFLRDLEWFNEAMAQTEAFLRNNGMQD